MKLICQKEHQEILKEKFKAYEDIDIVLVEYGEHYEGMAYYFDYHHIEELLRYLEGLKHKKLLVGYQNERMYLIEIGDIVYIEGLSQDCYLYTKDQEYVSEYKLYELEELLQGTSLIRISKSIIVNLCYIHYIQSEPNMKYGLYMVTNVKLTLSRKYVPTFKEKIGKR